MKGGIFLILPWINFLNLTWCSDWNGYEVGHNEHEVVGLYDLKDTEYGFYIDMTSMEIIEVIFWGECE